jgi:tetratricopeptide (TPR) repeat protein
MSSAENDNSASEQADSAEPNPLQGGRWRPVRPEELLRKNIPEREAEVEPSSDPPSAPPPPPKVRLERRQELEHHLKSSPTDLNAFMELGRIYRSENRPMDARRVFQQALQIYPEEKELLWEYEEAVLARSLQQLREVSELSARLDTIETERELKRSKNDWACRRMDVCRARLARDSSQHHLRVTLAEAMTDAGMFEGAIDELDPVLDIDDLSANAFLIRGRCLLAMGKDVEAMAAFRASALRRAVVAPLKTRVIALRLLCETAERLGVALTLANYRKHLQQAEQETAQQT